MAWEVFVALVDPTGSITVSMVLLWVDCVVPDGTSGLVVDPDALAAFEATAFGLGGGRVILGSCFLFLNCIHNTNQQYQRFKLQPENLITKTQKGPTGACQFVYTDFW